MLPYVICFQFPTFSAIFRWYVTCSWLWGEKSSDIMLARLWHICCNFFWITWVSSIQIWLGLFILSVIWHQKVLPGFYSYTSIPFITEWTLIICCTFQCVVSSVLCLPTGQLYNYKTEDGGSILSQTPEGHAIEDDTYKGKPECQSDLHY